MWQIHDEAAAYFHDTTVSQDESAALIEHSRRFTDCLISELHTGCSAALMQERHQSYIPSIQQLNASEPRGSLYA